MGAAASDSARAIRRALSSLLDRLSDEAIISVIALAAWADRLQRGDAAATEDDELPGVAFLPADRPWLKRAAALADELAGDLDDAAAEAEAEVVAAAGRPAIQHVRTVREEAEFGRPTRYRIECLVNGQPRTGYASIAEYDAATSAAARFAVIWTVLSDA